MWKIAVGSIAERSRVVPRSRAAIVEGGVAEVVVRANRLVRGKLRRVEDVQGRAVGCIVDGYGRETFVVDEVQVVHDELVPLFSTTCSLAG